MAIKAPDGANKSYKSGHIQLDLEDNCCLVRYIYCVIEGAVGRRPAWGHLAEVRGF